MLGICNCVKLKTDLSTMRDVISVQLNAVTDEVDKARVDLRQYVQYWTGLDKVLDRGACAAPRLSACNDNGVERSTVDAPGVLQSRVCLHLQGLPSNMYRVRGLGCGRSHGRGSEERTV